MIPKDHLRRTYLGLRGLALAPFAHLRQRQPFPERVRKILLVRIDRIGDLVLSTPFLRNLRELFPSAEIVILGRGFTRAILYGAEFVDRVLVFEQGGDAGLLRQLACEGFDLAVDLHYDYELKTAFLARRTRARCSVGFDVGGRGVLFDVAVPARERKHFIEETFDILRTIGSEPRKCPPEISLCPQAYEEAADLISREGVTGRYAAFHPGGFYPAQRWPAAHFARLADLIATIGLLPVFVGGRDDLPLLHVITAMMTARGVFLPGSDIGVSAAVIARSALFIGNNSGPLHLACALNVPSVSTMGPTDPVRFWPVSERACVLRAKRIEQIPIEEMFAAAKRALSSAVAST